MAKSGGGPKKQSAVSRRQVRHSTGGNDFLDDFSAVPPQIVPITYCSDIHDTVTPHTNTLDFGVALTQPLARNPNPVDPIEMRVSREAVDQTLCW